MNEKSDMCTVIVMSCDEYSDILKVGAIFKNKYWGDCPFKYMLVTQTIQSDLDVWDEVVYTSATMLWMDRLKAAMEKVNTPFVFLMCDDFFFSKKIENKEIEEMLKLMEIQNIGSLKLIPTKMTKGLKLISKEYIEIPNDYRFRISYTAALWQTDYLKHFTDCGLNAWQSERQNSLQSREYPQKVWSLSYDKYGIFHTVMSGLWIRSAVHIFRTENIDESYYNKRGVKTLKMYLKDFIFNVVMAISPNIVTKLQSVFKIGRGF